MGSICFILFKLRGSWWFFIRFLGGLFLFSPVGSNFAPHSHDDVLISAEGAKNVENATY